MCKGRRLLVILGGLNCSRSIITLVCTSLPTPQLLVVHAPHNFSNNRLLTLSEASLFQCICPILDRSLQLCCIVTHTICHSTWHAFFMAAKHSNIFMWYFSPSILCCKHQISYCVAWNKYFVLLLVQESIPLTEMELRTKWEQALGPQYDVMVRNGNCKWRKVQWNTNGEGNSRYEQTFSSCSFVILAAM